MMLAWYRANKTGNKSQKNLGFQVSDKSTGSTDGDRKKL